MASVDNRVVKMEFDNRSFQQRIGVTTDSLGKLKQSLNFSNTANMQGIDKLSNNFGNMGGVVNNVTKGIGVLGVAAGVALGGLVTSTLAVGKQMAGALISPILEGGKERSLAIEQAKFQFRGLGLDVEAAMDSARNAVLGTAYGLGEAASAAAQLGASGIDVGDRMTSILRSIAGTAAMTGRSFREMSDIFTSSAATGVINTQDLQQFSTRGLNAAAAIAPILGMTEMEVRRLASEGELSFDVFSTAMDEAFGKHATKANETYTGSLANMRAAMARLGASIQTPFLEKLRVLFNALTPVIDQLAKTFIPLINTMTIIFGIPIGKLLDRLTKGFDFSKLSVAIEAFSKGIFRAYLVLERIGKAIRFAFLEVFPKSLGQQVISLSIMFNKLVNALTPTPETLGKIYAIFRGLFSLFSIGFAIVKGITGVFVKLFSSFAKSTDSLNLLVKLSNIITGLKKSLVDGGKISEFFDNIGKSLSKLISFGIEKVFGGISAVFAILGDISGRLAVRFGFIVNAGAPLAAFFSFLTEKAGELLSYLGKLLGFVLGKFSGLSGGLKDGLGKPDFSVFLDAVNTGLFAGLLLILKRFSDGSMFSDIVAVLKNLLNGGGLNALSGGLLKQVSEGLEQFTDVMAAMEQSIKADAILKIAIAMGVLTLSLLVLSTIDSANLAKALIAVAAGIGILVGTLAILEKVATGSGSIKIGVLALSLIALAAAVLILALSVKLLSSMSWEELAKGLLGVAAILAMVTLMVRAMPNAKTLILTGIGIAAIAIGVRILASAVVALGSMEFDKLKQGLLGLAIILVMVKGIVETMPSAPQLIAIGVGLILLGVSIGLLTGSVLALGAMDYGSLKQGLLGLGLILGGLALFINLMPDKTAMIAIGIGLTLISGAVVVLMSAVVGLGSMDLGKMIQGLVGVAAMLLILAVAVKVMQSNVAGAITIAILAGSLLVLSIALNAFAGISWGELIRSLVIIAAVFALLALAVHLLTPVIPAMLALGVALLIFGAAAALVGVGVILLATGLNILVGSAIDIVETLTMVFNVLIDKLPILVLALGEALIKLYEKFAEALPGIINKLGEALLTLINKLRELIPAFMLLIGDIISGILGLIRQKVPEYIATGMFILISLLKGIRDNIFQVVTLVGEIIVNFINALSVQLPKIIAAGVNLLTKLIEGISSVMYIVGLASLTILSAFIDGLTAGVDTLITAGTDLIVAVIKGVGKAAQRIITAGVETFEKFLEGLNRNINRIVTAAFEFILTFLQNLTAAVELYLPEIRAEGVKLMEAIINGMTGGLLDKFKGVANKVKEGLGGVVNAAKGFLGISSPSKVFRDIGKNIVDGLVIGIDNNASAIKSTKNLGKNVTKSMNSALTGVMESLSILDEFNPVITPVLDLTAIESGSARLNRMFATPMIDTSSSFGQASAIAMAGTNAKNDTAQVMQTTNEIKFEQIINAPTALTTNDIYRNTKTQISMAKEELKIT
jgi:tape measure domain-containing protein